MTANDILTKAKSIADSKTFYVRGMSGQKLTDANKLRFSSNDPFNMKRTKLIFAESAETQGYDEFGFFADVTGRKCKNVGEVISICHDISKDFKSIVPGEVVFMGDRFGIFIGGGRVIAVSPAGVGYTILKGWVSHGRINDVDYEEMKDDKEEMGRVTESDRPTDDTPEETAESAPEVAVRPSGTGSGDRVLEVPPQIKSYDRSHGRRRS